MGETFRIIITVPSLNDEYDTKLEQYLRNKPYQHIHRNDGTMSYRVIVLTRIPSNLYAKIHTDFGNIYNGHKYADKCSIEKFSEDAYQV